MGFLTDLFRGLAPMDEQPQTRGLDPWGGYLPLDAQLSALWNKRAGPFRVPSIQEALGVPAIQRAVSMISNTVGTLSIQSYRNGAPTVDVAALLARPDPYSTPGAFYRDSAYNLATRGECVWWIARRDADDLPISLVVVPLAELNIDPNTDDRLRPIYRWGATESTRFSPATRTGQFVHVTYLKEPGSLRGVGPLQLCGVAASVAVEAQDWAANFFAEGGYASTLLRASRDLGVDVDTGENEADLLRRQWLEQAQNQVRVVDPFVEDVVQPKIDAAGATMLEAREFQNGDAARMFGIPGALLEYSVAGSSLTYQNIAEVYTQFVRTTLAPNYLEPMEQALTDLLPRSTIARFDVTGLQRADMKTRYETWQIGIESGIVTPEYAQQQEGIIPGSVELAPVPFAPPAAVPSRLPDNDNLGTVTSGSVLFSAEPEVVRCTGKFMLHGLLKPCRKVLGPVQPGFVCPRCGKEYEAAA